MSFILPLIWIKLSFTILLSGFVRFRLPYMWWCFLYSTSSQFIYNFLPFSFSVSNLPASLMCALLRNQGLSRDHWRTIKLCGLLPLGCTWELDTWSSFHACQNIQIGILFTVNEIIVMSIGSFGSRFGFKKTITHLIRNLFWHGI